MEGRAGVGTRIDADEVGDRGGAAGAQGTDQGRRFSRMVRPSSSQRRPIRAEASPQAPMRREYSSAWTLVPGKSGMVRKRCGRGKVGLEGPGPRALPGDDGFCRTTIPRAAVRIGVPAARSVPGASSVRIPLRSPGQVLTVPLAWARVLGGDGGAR